mgnify:FL=1
MHVLQKGRTRYERIFVARRAGRRSGFWRSAAKSTDKQRSYENKYIDDPPDLPAMAGRQCRGNGARGKGSRRCRTGILPRGAAARLPGSLRRAGNAHRSRLHPDRGTQGDGRCTRPRRHSPADESRAGDAAGERSRQDRDPGRGLLRERGAVHLPCREIRR